MPHTPTHTPTDTMQDSDQCVEVFISTPHEELIDAPDVGGEEVEEEEYYEETPREHVYTTRSGRAVYSVKRLIVPIPGNNADLAALAEFDAVHGEDCEDGLSQHSANTTDDDDDEDMSEMDESEEEEDYDEEEEEGTSESEEGEVEEGEVVGEGGVEKNSE